MSQKAKEGWIEWTGGDCPIKDVRTKFDVMLDGGHIPLNDRSASTWIWAHKGWGSDIIAYRIIEAHGADAEPARPTPFPASYSELVFDDGGWSQTIIVDGKRPEWLRDDDRCWHVSGKPEGGWLAAHLEEELAIRVRRREPKRETVRCWVKVTFEGNGPYESGNATIDLIDGTPDLSTLKIAEDAL